MTFGWLEPATFLIERWTVPSAFDGIAIIGAGEERDTCRRYYFDARGQHRIYEMTLGHGVWKQWRDAEDPFPQRFHATLDDDGETITGRWEKRPGDGDWEPDIDITYRKVT